jgi:hypothetical protein
MVQQAGCLFICNYLALDDGGWPEHVDFLMKVF